MKSSVAQSTAACAGPKGEVTPLWGYYQPILKAIVAAGGECLRSDIESAIEADDFLQVADRSPMSGGRERWKVMIRRARKPLLAEGWIEDEISTKWRVTDEGRKAADRRDRRRDAKARGCAKCRSWLRPCSFRSLSEAGADVLAHADIESPGAAGPAGVQRDTDPEGAAMTLRFIVAGRDRVPVGEEAPA